MTEKVEKNLTLRPTFVTVKNKINNFEMCTISFDQGLNRNGTKISLEFFNMRVDIEINQGDTS